MSYPVLNTFIEKEHENMLYKKGEEYPKKGFSADQKRVSFLQKKHRKYKVSFLGDEVKAEPKAPAGDKDGAK